MGSTLIIEAVSNSVSALEITRVIDLVIAQPHRWHPRIVDAYFDSVCFRDDLQTSIEFTQWAMRRNLRLTDGEETCDACALRIVIGRSSDLEAGPIKSSVPTLFVGVDTGRIDSHHPLQADETVLDVVPPIQKHDNLTSTRVC